MNRSVMPGVGRWQPVTDPLPRTACGLEEGYGSTAHMAKDK
jgi:hypothetical protein